MKWLRIILIALLAMLVACAKPDPSVILGNWRTESFKLDSLNLPIAPNFEVTRNELILKSPDSTILEKLPLAALRAKDKSIEIEFKNGLGVSIEFLVDTKDRVRLKVPFMPIDIVYNRI